MFSNADMAYSIIHTFMRANITSTIRVCYLRVNSPLSEYSYSKWIAISWRQSLVLLHLWPWHILFLPGGETSGFKSNYIQEDKVHRAPVHDLDSFKIRFASHAPRHRSHVYLETPPYDGIVSTSSSEHVFMVAKIENYRSFEEATACRMVLWLLTVHYIITTSCSMFSFVGC